MQPDGKSLKGDDHRHFLLGAIVPMSSPHLVWFQADNAPRLSLNVLKLVDCGAIVPFRVGRFVRRLAKACPDGVWLGILLPQNLVLLVADRKIQRVIGATGRLGRQTLSDFLVVSIDELVEAIWLSCNQDQLAWSFVR